VTLQTAWHSIDLDLLLVLSALLVAVEIMRESGGSTTPSRRRSRGSTVRDRLPR
jgi:hypothetical protein